MTSETREALDLLSVSDAVDVRLLKVMAFGENAANVHPFTLRNRSSYHRTDWAARAQWEAHSHSWELPPSDDQPRARWRIKLNGQLHRAQNVEIGESFEQPGMALMVRSFDSDVDLAPTDFLFSTLCASFRSVRHIFALRPTRTRSFSWENFRLLDSVKIDGRAHYTHCAPYRFPFRDTLHLKYLFSTLLHISDRSIPHFYAATIIRRTLTSGQYFLVVSLLLYQSVVYRVVICNIDCCIS